jgi:hypothetical protein
MEKTDTASLSIHLNSGEYLETKKLKAKKQPNFFKIGNGTMNKHSIQSLDFIQEMADMTKSELLVIVTVKDLYTWDNENGEVYIPLSKKFTKVESKTFLKGFKILQEKNLVRRTKQSHYMINPNAIFLLDYQKGLKLWDSVESDNR